MKAGIVVVIVALVALVPNMSVRSCRAEEPDEKSSRKALTDEELLTRVQRRTLQYFWEGAQKHSLAARERIHLDEPDLDANCVTSGGSGFGLMAILVGIERGFVKRSDAVMRLERILEFFEKADRFHGVWPHWLHGDTGKVRPFSEKDDGGDLVETSFLAQGLLCVRQYFQDGNTREQKLAQQADKLWRQIDWDWYRGKDRENVLFWHWSPNHAWDMDFRIHGYNECLITYVLAVASPTHGVPPAVYHQGWAEKGRIQNKTTEYGIPLRLKHQGIQKYCGPLFWAHYSFLGLDPRGLEDQYADYWRHNRNHVRMVHAYCVNNPKNHAGYSKDCWGLTSSYSLNGYSGHCPENDEGTITPTAALGSFPYEPEHCMAALRFFHDTQGEKLFGKYGFYDAFNLGKDWFPPRYLAIDQGPIVVMIENHRTGLLWDLFMSCPEVRTGLTKIGMKHRDIGQPE